MPLVGSGAACRAVCRPGKAKAGYARRNGETANAIIELIQTAAVVMAAVLPAALGTGRTGQ
ncbi:hypothetical protein HMPREF0758_4715 [Serratia odorifera DSM 4582]|uniref:Uncharacterized protein n=1 Tax=Serratia odorifera DSM 4582 TaxID=667129 RepID=D4E965_SEROD|nr:hypothetical protein HMPREF0758_4715 [Serratia odorifera DSM 4582]